MTDFVLVRKSRNILSTIIHIVLNIFLGVGSIIVTLITGSWFLGLALVLLSKWRIFAVRPRYWLINIKSNLVDLIVGASIVFIAYCSGPTLLPIHTILAVIYTLWLIILKPRSSELAANLQSLIAVFLGTTAVTLMAASADAIFMVLPCFIIGYGAARHVIVQSDDHDFALVNLIAGLIAAEVAWLCHNWLIVYVFGASGILLPQLSILMTVLAFTSGILYRSTLKHDGKLKDAAMPIIFCVLVITIVVVWFSKPIFNV